MTRILALETAGETCSVALLEGDALIERFETTPRRQTERILPLVREVLAQAQCSLTQMDAIAFGQGPGSFTGVRVAAAVTQGLAFAADLPVVGVSTLAACAATAYQQEPHPWIVASFDARMGQLYLGAYQYRQAQFVPILADGLYDPEQLPFLPEREWWLVGNGTERYQKTLSQQYHSDRVSRDVQPRASAVARLALSSVQAGKTVSAELAQPVYLRDQVIQGAVR